MPRAIPERQPIGDLFRGVVLQVGTAQALALAAQPGADVLSEGEFIVRYGIRFLGKSHLSIVPGLVVLDYGDILTGDEAWDFLLKRSNLYPRSEVVGYRNDGADDMVLIRNLDLAQPVQTLVYNGAASTTPIARPTALIAPDTSSLPPRLVDYLPVFPSVANWRAERPS
jgi:hypothetical protein